MCDWWYSNGWFEGIMHMHYVLLKTQGNCIRTHNSFWWQFQGKNTYFWVYFQFRCMRNSAEDCKSSGFPYMGPFCLWKNCLRGICSSRLNQHYCQDRNTLKGTRTENNKTLDAYFVLDRPSYYNTVLHFDSWILKAMPWLRWLVTSLLPHRHGFNPRPIHVVYVGDKVADKFLSE